jgi:hypothetical protein
MVFLLEFFRMDHGHEEVAEQGEGDEPDEDGFHGFVGLERSAETDIKNRRHEQRDDGGGIDEIGDG